MHERVAAKDWHQHLQEGLRNDLRNWKGVLRESHARQEEGHRHALRHESPQEGRDHQEELSRSHHG